MYCVWISNKKGDIIDLADKPRDFATLKEASDRLGELFACRDMKYDPTTGRAMDLQWDTSTTPWTPLEQGRDICPDLTHGTGIGYADEDPLNEVSVTYVNGHLVHFWCWYGYTGHIRDANNDPIEP